MNGQMKNYNAYFEQVNKIHGPYSREEIPSFKIDYRGLLRYAKEKGKKVIELSDSEKEQFTFGVPISSIKSKMLKA